MAKFKTQLDNWFLVQLTNPKAMTHMSLKRFMMRCYLCLGFIKFVSLKIIHERPLYLFSDLRWKTIQPCSAKAASLTSSFPFWWWHSSKLCSRSLIKSFFLQGEALTEVFTFHLKSLRNLLRGSNWIQWPGWTQMK